MKTRITELLGIEYPVVQGAMARIADGGLAGAVSEAGGLGIIACGGARPEWIREQVARARALTSKPIGINVMLMDPRAGVVAELVCELGVEVVTTGAGSPANYMKMWKDAGVKVVPVVASSALAARMERLGADAVVADGECEVNESLITGESDPILKRPGDSLLSGSFVVSGSDEQQPGTRLEEIKVIRKGAAQ